LINPKASPSEYDNYSDTVEHDAFGHRGIRRRGSIASKVAQPARACNVISAGMTGLKSVGRFAANPLGNAEASAPF
jgi:hypothetical protein